MRLTKELEKRIEERFAGKFKAELDSLYLLKRSLKDKIKASVTKEVNRLMEESPILAVFISNQLYGEWRPERVEEMIFSRSRMEYPLADSDEFFRVEADIRILDERKKKEIEDFKILIAYSKDIKDLKGLFANSGIEF